MEKLLDIFNILVPLAGLVVYLSSASKNKERRDRALANKPEKKQKIQEAKPINHTISFSKVLSEDIFKKDGLNNDRSIAKTNKNIKRKEIQKKQEGGKNIQKNDSTQNREINPSLLEQNPKSFIEEEKGEQETNWLVFSEDPLINGLIYSEILGKPKFFEDN